MKSLRILSFLLAGLLMTACSDDTPRGTGDEKLYDINLNFDLALSSERSTRSPRPLESSDNWQKTDDVRVYVFRSTSGQGDASFRLYSPEVKDPTTGATSKQPYFYISAFEKDGDEPYKESIEAHHYTINPRLPEGYYRFLAVGRDDDRATTPLSMDWREGVTDWTTAMMENNSGTPRATEIFSGYAKDSEGKPLSYHITADKQALYSTITLYRAVAGVFMFLKNIPATVASDFAWKVGTSATGVLQQDIEKGTVGRIREVAIVSVGRNPVMNLVKRTYEDPFVTETGRFSINRIVSIKTDTIGEAVGNYYPRRVFAGNFVFPTNLYKREPFYLDFDKGEKPGISLSGDEEFTAFDKSLYLALFAISGSGEYYPMKLIPIRIVRHIYTDEDMEDECGGDNVVGDDFEEGLGYGYQFNLVANHFYGLGRRNTTTDDYVPVDLKDVENISKLEIEVVGSWQANIDIEL